MRRRALCDTWESSDISLVVDVAVRFDPSVFDAMLQVLAEDSSIVMVTPFGELVKDVHATTPLGMFSVPRYDWTPRLRDGLLYYDSYAFETTKGTAGSTLVNGGRAPVFYNRIERVHAAFAGFAMLRSKALRQSEWLATSALRSEHIAFCAAMRRHGDVVVATHIRVWWHQVDHMNQGTGAAVALLTAANAAVWIYYIGTALPATTAIVRRGLERLATRFAESAMPTNRSCGLPRTHAAGSSPPIPCAQALFAVTHAAPVTVALVGLVHLLTAVCRNNF